MIHKRSLEPVKEEYIEEEPDTPVILPDVVKDSAKMLNENASHQESPHMNNKRSRVSSSNKQQQVSQANSLINNVQDLSASASTNNAFSSSQPIQMSQFKPNLNQNAQNGPNSYQNNSQLAANQNSGANNMSNSQ